MKNIIITLLIATSLFLGLKWYLSVGVMNAEDKITMADREYWRTVASTPQSVCVLRGGKFQTTGFTSDFRGHDTISYKCEGAQQ